MTTHGSQPKYAWADALWLTAAAVLAVAIYQLGQAANAGTATPPPTVLIATLDYSFWAAGFFGMLALIGCAIAAAMATVAPPRTSGLRAPHAAPRRLPPSRSVSYGLVALLAAPW